MNKKRIIVFLAAAMLFFTAGSYAQTWTQKQNYPVSAGGDGAFCFSINDTIYAGGGVSSKLFRAYDPAGNQWYTKANLPATTDRSFAVGFSINGKGYMGLGLDGSTSKSDLWEYDPSLNTWTQKQGFPGLAHDGMFCFVINNIAYIGGGEDPFSMAQYDSVYSYNPSLNQWGRVANFPLGGIIYPFSFAINGKGYVACGYQSTEIINTWQYDPVGNSWSAKANYTGAARQAGVSFVLNNIAYCGLGMDAAGFFNSFYAYDPDAGSWAASDSLPASPRSFPIAAVAGNKAYAGIGWSYTSSSNLYKDWWEFSLPTSGIQEIAKGSNGFTIFPNPASQVMNIEFGDKAKHYFEISAMSGKIMQCGVLNGRDNIDISGLPTGVYSIVVQGAGTRKFVKE